MGNPFSIYTSALHPGLTPRTTRVRCGGKGASEAHFPAAPGRWRCLCDVTCWRCPLTYRHTSCRTPLIEPLVPLAEPRAPLTEPCAPADPLAPLGVWCSLFLTPLYVQSPAPQQTHRRHWEIPWCVNRSVDVKYFPTKYPI